MPWTIAQLSPKLRMSERRSNTMSAFVERSDCGNNLVSLSWHILGHLSWFPKGKHFDFALRIARDMENWHFVASQLWSYFRGTSQGHEHRFDIFVLPSSWSIIAPKISLTAPGALFVLYTHIHAVRRARTNHSQWEPYLAHTVKMWVMNLCVHLCNDHNYYIILS